MSYNMDERIFRNQVKARRKGKELESTFGSSYKTIYGEYYDIYYNWFYNLVINMIKYEGAPVSFDASGLEYMLRTFGYATIQATDPEHVYVTGINSENIGLGQFGDIFSVADPLPLVGKTTQLTRVNAGELAVGTPVRLTLANKFTYLTQGQSDDLKLIERTAKTLAEIKASAILNLRQMKTPLVGFTTDGGLTTKNLWHQIAEGQAFIEVDSQLGDLSSVVQPLQLNTQNLLPALKDEWNNNLQELLTILGIKSIAVDKAERLVTGEANANNQLIGTSLSVYLDARNERLDLLNRQLGTNIHATLDRQTLMEIGDVLNGAIYSINSDNADELRPDVANQSEE